MTLKVLDLFAGIGGFSRGLESTGGFETVGFCEQDKFCQKVLAKNYPNINIFDDVRSINGTTIQADVVTGGFPCQGFSQAGKQKGTSDERYLWPEMLRVISEVKPRWVIGENVQGIINIEDGMVLRQVHNDLESEGFKVQCFVIPASGKGAWHQRNRVWIIAHSDSNRESRLSQYVHERSGQLGKPSKNDTNSQCLGLGSRSTEPGKFEEQPKGSDKYINSDQRLSCRKTSARMDVPNAKRKGLQRHDTESGQHEQEVRHTSDKDNETETWWEVESKFFGIPDGLSSELDSNRNQRIKTLGNSIVPQIAFEIGNAIIQAEQ
jgi:DNA (cytosine-5)-methyltransferase 1